MAQRVRDIMTSAPVTVEPQSSVTRDPESALGDVSAAKSNT